MIIPLYQAELCHPSIRGRVTALQQFMLGVGALVAAWISYGKPGTPFYLRKKRKEEKKSSQDTF
jgi:hypothetical protein